MRLGRIARKADFSDILRKGKQARCHGIVIFHRPSACGPRLGFAVGRAAGNAVQRNRLRRVVREWLRRQNLPAIDLVVSLRAPIRPMTNDDVRDSMSTLLRNNGWLT